MSKQVVITEPNGDKTTIQSNGGCGNGCGWLFAIALVIGACINAPILIVPTMAVTGFIASLVYVKGKNK